MAGYATNDSAPRWLAQISVKVEAGCPCGPSPYGASVGGGVG